MDEFAKLVHTMKWPECLYPTTGNPGSLCVCVSRNVTCVNIEAKFRSENLLENGNKNW